MTALWARASESQELPLSCSIWKKKTVVVSRPTKQCFPKVNSLEFSSWLCLCQPCPWMAYRITSHRVFFFWNKNLESWIGWICGEMNREEKQNKLAALIHCTDKADWLVQCSVQGVDLEYLIRLLWQPWEDGQEGTPPLFHRWRQWAHGYLVQIIHWLAAWIRTTPCTFQR